MRTLQRWGSSGVGAHGFRSPMQRAVAAAACILVLAPSALAAPVAAPGVAAGAASVSAADPAPVFPSTSRGNASRRAQRLLLERAKERYEAGRAAEDAAAARPHFEGALDALHLTYRLWPAPWLLFNMAQVQSRLGACNEAADLYQRFLASNPAPAARANAEQALDLLGTCEDGGLAAAPDDSMEPGLLLAPDLTSMFEPDPAVPPPAVPPAQAPAATRVADILPWAFGGLAVMSGVAATVYWQEANSAKSDLDALSVAGPEVARTQQRGESALELSRIFGGVAVGFALAAVGSYWWLEHEKKEAPLAAALGGLSLTPLEGGAAAAFHSEF
jgi:hypothetical protein